jgi:phage terminase small subunit
MACRAVKKGRKEKKLAVLTPASLPQWAIDLLDQKERRFLEEYLVDLNASAAVVRAGFTANHESSLSRYLLGCNFLARPAVAEAIEKLASERAVTRVWLFDLLCKWARADHTRYVKISEDGVTVTPTDELTQDERLCVTRVKETKSESGRTVEVEIEDRQGAVAKLMKILKMDVQRTEVSGLNGGPIEVSDPKARVMARLEAMAKKLADEAAAKDGTAVLPGGTV